MNTASAAHSTTSPNTGAIAPTTPTKKPAFQGPCYLKMLVSNLVAGSIIGKNGAVISSIENSTGASMKLSPTSSFFPGTPDRIVVMSGEQDQLNRALSIILEKINEVSAVQDQDLRDAASATDIACKIVVPKSAVSGIIGKAGQQIKQLQEDTATKIQISNRNSEMGLNERVVAITGQPSNVHQAAVQISTEIQDDQNLRDYMYVIYNTTMGPSTGGGGGMYSPSGGGGSGGYGQYMPHNSGSAIHPFGTPFGTSDVIMEPCEISMEMPDGSIGPVIGRNGAHLNEIMRSTGATVKLSQKGDLVPGTQNRRVTINGSVQSVYRAHSSLLRRLKETNNSQAGRPGGGGGGYIGASSPMGLQGGPTHGAYSQMPINHFGGGQIGGGGGGNYGAQQAFGPTY